LGRADKTFNHLVLTTGALENNSRKKLKDEEKGRKQGSKWLSGGFDARLTTNKDPEIEHTPRVFIPYLLGGAR